MLLSSVFVLLLLLIGSSFAEITDADRIQSLQQLHSLVKDYIINLSKIYYGYQGLLSSEEYKKFTAQEDSEILSDGVATITLNQAVSNDAVTSDAVSNDSEPQQEAVSTAAQTINTWKDLAVASIQYCTKTADTFVQNGVALKEDYSTYVQREIVEKTVQVMQNINKDPKIINEQKRNGCPIYEHLETVIKTYGGIQASINFRRNYGSDKNEQNDDNDSSIAYTDSQRIESLEKLHPLVDKYILNLSKTYDENGSKAFEETQKYKAFKNQKDAINSSYSNILDKDLPNAQKRVLTVKQIIDTWKEKAIAAIQQCIDNAETIKNDENAEEIGKGIIDATEEVMDLINKNDEIIDEQKKSSCPIYENLKNIMETYGTKKEFSDFKNKYG